MAVRVSGTGDMAATPPPLTPPHKGEGGSEAPASKTPSPLWGGVRGGGTLQQALAGSINSRRNSAP